MMQKLKLSAAWSARLRLRAEGDKLRAEGDKLRAEGAKLWAEGDKLRAEGDKLWAEAILEVYGNIALEWSWDTYYGECTLENGDRYCDDQEGQVS
jgi:hypothetical protein